MSAWSGQARVDIHTNSSPEMPSVTFNFADWLEAIFWRSFWHILWHSFWQYLRTVFLTYQRQNIASTASHKSHSTNSIFTSHHAAKVISMTTLCLSNGNSTVAFDGIGQPPRSSWVQKMQSACSNTHTHTPHASDSPAKKAVESPCKWAHSRNYISWRVQTMKSDACHCASCTSSV